MDVCTACKNIAESDSCISLDKLPVGHFSHEEVYGYSKKGGFVEPVPDPFGQPFARPRVSKLKAQAKTKMVQDSSIKRAPVQALMSEMRVGDRADVPRKDTIEVGDKVQTLVAVDHWELSASDIGIAVSIIPGRRIGEYEIMFDGGKGYLHADQIKLFSKAVKLGIGDRVEAFLGKELRLEDKELVKADDIGLVTRFFDDEGIAKMEITWTRTGEVSTLRMDSWQEHIVFKEKAPPKRLLVSGAIGRHAAIVNGVYDQIDTYNDRPSWQKRDDKAKWLVWMGNFWYITSTKAKGASKSEGWAQGKDGALPTHAEAWKVLNNGVWESQSLVVSQAAFGVEGATEEDGQDRSYARIAENEVFERAWWCLYCCCSGIGLGSVVHQRSLSKCACWRAEIESDDFTHDRDGMVNCIVSPCCCHALCQVPRRDKTPDCMCCDEIQGNLHRREVYKVDRARKTEELEDGSKFAQVEPFDIIMSEAFTACYYRFFGCSVTIDSFLPFRNSCCIGNCKFGYCSSNYQCVFPNSLAECYHEEYGFCTQVTTCLCLYVHCRLPPHLITVRKAMCPLVAVCGRNLWLPNPVDKKSPWVKPVPPAAN